MISTPDRVEIVTHELSYQYTKSLLSHIGDSKEIDVFFFGANKRMRPERFLQQFRRSTTWKKGDRVRYNLEICCPLIEKYDAKNEDKCEIIRIRIHAKNYLSSSAAAPHNRGGHVDT